MGGPVAGKTFVVGRLFGLHREFLGFSHRKQVVDDPIRFGTVAGEIEGHAYAGKVGDIRIDFAHVFIGSFPFFIPLRHLDFEPAGALGARGYHGADTGGAQGILQHFGGNASCCFVKVYFLLVIFYKLIYQIHIDCLLIVSYGRSQSSLGRDWPPSEYMIVFVLYSKIKSS